MKKLLLPLGFFLLPAAALGAGFAQQSLFLSKSSVTEGDVVLIHAVVQNDSATPFPGNVVIRDEGAKVGSVPVTLEAGEAQAVSVSWKPRAGSRRVVAELEDKAGTVVESESAVFAIKEKPAPAKPSASSSSAAAVESSEGIQSRIESLSPAVGGAVAPVLRLVDGSREALAGVLDSQLASVKPKVTTLPIPGVVAGAETIKAPDEQNWFWSIAYTVYFYILTVLRYVVGSAGVFYPLLAVIFFFVLWRTYKRFRRP